MKINTAKLKRRTSPRPWIAFASATDEIKLALGVIDEVAAMILQGLCATGNVLACDAQQQVIDPEECTIATYEVRVYYVDADAVRHFLAEWSPAPQPALIDVEIAKRLPRRIPWKQFCDQVRDACNGWRSPGEPAWGFGDKQIKRSVKDLQAR
jgi:hypothetical protein